MPFAGHRFPANAPRACDEGRTALYDSVSPATTGWHTRASKSAFWHGAATVVTASGCREDERRTRRLIEIELAREVTEDRDVLANRRARVGPAVGRGIEALAAQEIVLDELEIRIEAERLMVDVAALGIGADD